LKFADEKKELVLEDNGCSRLASRLAILLYITLLALITGVAYSRSDHVQRPELSQVWAACFFASQILSFLLITPSVLSLHAFFFANGVYKCLCCGSERCLGRTMPLSYVLYTDFVEQSSQMKEIQRRGGGDLQEDAVA